MTFCMPQGILSNLGNASRSKQANPQGKNICTAPVYPTSDM